MKLAHTLLRQIMHYLLGTVGAALMTLVSTIVFTRLVGAQEFGIYVLGIATANIAAAIAGEWLKQAVGRYAPGVLDDISWRGLINALSVGLTSIFLIESLIITFFFTAYKIVGAPFGELQNRMVYEIGGCMLGTTLFVVLLGFLQGRFHSRAASMYQFVLAICKLMFGLALTTMVGKTAHALLLGQASALLLTSTLMWFHAGLPLKIALWREKTSWTILGTMAQYGLPFLGWFVGSQILNNGDRYVLQYFLGNAEVGIYSANYTIIYGVVTMASAPLSLALAPHLMKAWDAGKHVSVQQSISRATYLYLSAALPIIVLIFYYSRQIASLFLGAEFVRGHFIMGPVALGVVIWQLATYGHKGFEFTGKTKAIMIFVLIGALFNIVQNVLFVPILGTAAAAWSTVTSYFCYAILVFYASRNNLAWQIHWVKIGQLIAAIIAGLGVLLLISKSNSGMAVDFKKVAGGVGFVLMYSCTLYIIRIFRKEHA